MPLTFKVADEHRVVGAAEIAKNKVFVDLLGGPFTLFVKLIRRFLNFA
jgi:hypothetical protein